MSEIGYSIRWKEWKVNGIYHREEGPAFILKNGQKNWCTSVNLNNEIDVREVGTICSNGFKGFKHKSQKAL